MAQHLPPLAALRAFEAAARHLNFTRAAEELHLTHGAISHQMKALEASLGTRLFRRDGKKLLLTDAGQRFASRLRDLLGDLRAAVAEVDKRRDQQELTISVLPSFASLWLIPRLARFHTAHPEIDVNIRATQALAEFGKRDDAWLMAVDRDWPWGPTNNYCKWFHVCEHEAHHTGQIAFLRKRLPGAKPDTD
jgi:LysR family glycine cleavage system transcriptional activator